MKTFFKNRVAIFTVLFFLVSLTLASADATPQVPGDWKGYASINSTIASDTTPVSAYLDGSSSAAVSTAVGAVEANTGYYLIHVPSGGTNVTFKICGVTAYPSNNTPQTWSAGPHPQGSSPYYNISINTQANGAACTYACGCSGGYCNSNVCANSAPAATTTTSPATGGTSVSGTTGTAGATTPAATTPAAEVATEKTVITDTIVINDLLSSLKPSDLGVASLDPSKVDVVRIGTASAISVFTDSTVNSALSAASEDAAKQAINEIETSITSGSSEPIQVSAKLEVYNITSKETNRTSVVSKITLTITADKDMKNVKVVEVIPKDVASSVAGVVFKVQPVILQSDPIVQWTFDSLQKGETKDLSYTVNKKLSSISSISLAAAKASQAVQPPAQPVQPTQQPAKPADMTIVFVAAAIVVILALGILFYFKAMKKRGSAWKPGKWSSGKRA